MDEIKVSICVLSYNHEKYLRDCLDGVMMQKTTFSIEVWVHDDASTDSSSAIIKEYQERYPNTIKPILQIENQYSKGERILAKFVYPRCAGTYIALCEGDDYWIDPFKLQKQVDFMDQHPDFIACFHNARIQYKDHVSLFNDLEENHYPSTEDIIKRRWFIATVSLLFRNCLKEMPEWSKGVINGDYLTELLLAKEGRFYYMDDVMAVYRQDGMGMSAVLNRNKVDMTDKLIFLLDNMKPLYGDEYAAVFDESIANYQRIRANCAKEAYYEAHPLARLLRPKTYKRMIKKWLKRIIK